MHMMSQNIDGGASAPVGPSVATPLLQNQTHHASQQDT